MRAIVRQQGLRSGSLAEAELRKAREVLTALLIDQCNYHKTVTAPRMKRLEHRLERAGEIFFLGTLLVASAYLVFAAYSGMAGNPLSHDADALVKYSVAAVSAAFPALATAFYGIRVIGDFEGIAQRSERTHIALQKLIDVIEKEPPDLIVLRARARAAADAMLGDVASWRLAAESRGLSLP